MLVRARAALIPTVPAPMMTTSAGGTPGAPESRVPLPPDWFSSKRAAICKARRPAISLTGPRTGRSPLSVCTISQARAVAPVF